MMLSGQCWPRGQSIPGEVLASSPALCTVKTHAPKGSSHHCSRLLPRGGRQHFRKVVCADLDAGLKVMQKQQLPIPISCVYFNDF